MSCENSSSERHVVVASNDDSLRVAFRLSMLKLLNLLSLPYKLSPLIPLKTNIFKRAR